MEHRSLTTGERLVLGLIKRIKQGDCEAFSKLYDIYFEPLYRYFYYRANSADVEDLLETVFLKTWTNLAKFRFDKTGESLSKNSFSAWIFRIAHNVLVDFYRAHQQIRQISEDHVDTKKESRSQHIIEEKLRKESLKKALARLKTSYQQIIVLKFINELSNAEIAQILGKTENSLRILQFRALRSLKRELESMGITNYEA